MERELPGVELSEFVAIFCKSPDGSRRSANKVHAIQGKLGGDRREVSQFLSQKKPGLADLLQAQAGTKYRSPISVGVTVGMSE